MDTTGIAPGAAIIDVKVLGADGSGNVADVIAGLDWVLYNARQYNIRVVNLSLSAGSTTSWVQDPLAQAARAVVASGIVVVTAAGNYGQPPARPPWAPSARRGMTRRCSPSARRT